MPRIPSLLQGRWYILQHILYFFWKQLEIFRIAIWTFCIIVYSSSFIRMAITSNSEIMIFAYGLMSNFLCTHYYRFMPFCTCSKIQTLLHALITVVGARQFLSRHYCHTPIHVTLMQLLTFVHHRCNIFRTWLFVPVIWSLV